MNLKNFFAMCSTPEPIKDKSDYRRVKAWLIKICVLYIIFTVIAIVIIAMPSSSTSAELPSAAASVLVPIVTVLTCWGLATLIVYFRPIFKSVISTGKAGYGVGKQVQTNKVDVSHEYGNTYRVTGRTEDKGCLFAVIAGSLKFCVWAFFCIYIGPFLTFKKAFGSVKKLNAFSAH